MVFPMVYSKSISKAVFQSHFPIPFYNVIYNATLQR
jgi:hypothetical protein